MDIMTPIIAPFPVFVHQPQPVSPRQSLRGVPRRFKPGAPFYCGALKKYISQTRPR